MMAGQAGFFDVDDRLKRLSDLGDQLEVFAAAVDFEVFRPELETALAYSDGSRGGRPPFDPVMMFKVLVIQTVNTLSDERAEYLVNDRLSFMRFLGLGLSDRVPDARTIWLFREKLTRAGAMQRLFDRFDAMLRAAGYIAMSGQIVDASLVAAPRQRNTQAEKDDIKAGRVPQDWKRKPAKLRHKDRDARWTVKFTKAKPREDGSMPAVDLAIPAFGYRNHISIDRRFGFIRKWLTTDAAAHEGRRLRDGLLDKSNTAAGVWADTAYRSATNEASWPTTASSPVCIARSRRSGRCRRRRGGPTTPNPGSARASSMFSPSKSTEWSCSSAPSVCQERRPRSGLPISSTTSSGSSSSGAAQQREAGIDTNPRLIVR
jgi:IS5 family transposase